MSGHSTALNITPSGRIGIDTNDPNQKLHVHDSSTNATHIRTTNSNGDIFYGIDGNGAGYAWMNSGAGHFYVGTNGTGHLIAYAGSAERMRITSSGHVGIGTTSPDVLLDVGNSDHGSAGITGIQIQSSQDFSTTYDGSNAATWPGVQIVNHDDTANRTASGIKFVHRSSSSGIAAIQSTSNAADRADIRFITRGTGGSIAERVIIDYDGNVGIGSTAPATELEVAGTVYATAVDHGDGSSATRAATSALEILRYYGKKPSGNYWIKEPNAGTARQIYCDMETDGGGWMLWLEYNTGQNSMGAQGTQSNLAPAYNNGYANYEVMLDGSDVNNINKRSIRGVYELDANGEIRNSGTRQWGEHHLPENVGNPFVPNSDTFFNDAADGEYIQRTQYYAPLGGASPGWTSIGSGSLYVYVREPNPLVRNGDIKTYYGMPLVYDYYDSSKFGWHVPDYAYATGELGMSPGFAGIAIDGTDFPIASGYANRRIDVNNGNNGPSAQAILRGYLIGEFQIRFYLGYRWGWSEFILVDVKQAYESKYLGGAGSNINKNLYRVLNNNSNNISSYIGYDSAGTQTVSVNGTSYSEGATWVMWREQDGNIYAKDPGGTSRNLGKFVGPMVAMSGSQSPHMLEIRDVWSRGRNSTTSNNAGTNTQFRH
jgi:hypothetical protein